MNSKCPLDKLSGAIAALSLGVQIFLPAANAGVKIVILGSSTAAGAGASSNANSWAGLYQSYLLGIDSNNILINLAVPGYNTYNLLPTGSSNSIYGNVDPAHNITAALAYNPDVVLFALGNNDQGAAGVPIANITNNYITIANVAGQSNVAFWISTITPRDNVSLASAGPVRSFVTNYFGSHAIDFWTTLANADGTINSNYWVDGIHFNNAGHSVLFSRVVESSLDQFVRGGLTTTTELNATQNPSGFEEALNFTVQVQTNGILAGDATGTVIFATNGLALSTNNVSGGSTTSASVTTLPRGTNLITARYSGDLKYLGSTNTLQQVVTNHPPEVLPVSYNRLSGNGWTIPVSDLLTNSADVDGDSLTLAGVSTSTNSITLIVNGGVVQYENPNSVNDQFNYSVSDGFGGTNIGVVYLAITNPAVVPMPSQLILTASLNPSGFKDVLNFTAQVQTNAILAEDATGPVVFFTNGVVLSTNSLNGGTVVSASLDTLPRGTNLITASYAGDAKYLGSTNTVEQGVTNHPPAVYAASFIRELAGGWSIPVTDLLTNATDVDGDTLTLAGVGLSTNSIILVVDGPMLQYENSNLVADQFSYTVSDGFGGTNTAVINLTVSDSLLWPLLGRFDYFSNSVAYLTFHGIPAHDYVVQRSTNLLVPLGWLDIATNTASTNGTIPVEDAFLDLDGVAPSAAYYQSQAKP